jgi:hypothetical protein
VSQFLRVSRRDYCQFLLATQKNYTQTYLADHHAYFFHDAVNRYMISDHITPAEVWAKIRADIDLDENGYIIFDDTVLDKSHAKKIELAQIQYSGNAHGLVYGIGVVNCLYVNTNTGHSWIIDWRIFNPTVDKKNKLQHVMEMFDNAIAHKKLPFRAVLMDSWYATKDVMLHFDAAKKLFYCPLKSNRKADDSGGKGKASYKAVDSLTWSTEEKIYGKLVKLYEFPGEKKLKLFRVAATNRTEWIVTNDLSEDPDVPEGTDVSDDKLVKSTDSTRLTSFDVGLACAVRWKIEQYHREVKQTLGMEKCQCRKAASQKTHIGCVSLAWHFLTKMARAAGKTIYALKQDLLSEYMKRELAKPTLVMPKV